MLKNIVVIIPTFNAGSCLDKLLNSLSRQLNVSFSILIIDSGSTDQTIQIAYNYNCLIQCIDHKDFNHGGTRNRGALLYQLSDAYVFLTQDAILSCDRSLEYLLTCFDDLMVGAVCGRQIPHLDANPIAYHARLFNYPDKSKIKSILDVQNIGIKTIFLSNSYAAYRGSLFRELGGFPLNIIIAEDMYLAAKLIASGYKIAYCAEAEAYHSHNYSPWEEFCRYFDTGVFHACEPWIQQQFGGASKEGSKFLISELRYLLRHNPLWIPRSITTIMCKFIGYYLGVNYKFIPEKWVIFFSMHKKFWYEKQHSIRL